MPPDYVIFACFCLVLYFYINQSIQFRSTASAIRSVFSGDCRMTCRQSQVSGLSGISGLAQGPGEGLGQGPGPSQAQNALPVNCMCETCPCALIENFLLTCSPAARVYGALVAMLSQAYINFLQSIQDAHEFVQNAATCRASCRKPQLVATSPFESNDNFSFVDAERREGQQKLTDSRGLPAIKETTSKTSLHAAKAKFKDLFKKKKISANEMKESDVSETSSENEESSTLISAQKSGGCPRCIEEGKTCLRECPKSKK